MLTRRGVFVASATVAGAALGIGSAHPCTAQNNTTIADHRVRVASASPQLVIARGQDPARNTRAALDRMGGMKAFVQPGDVVVVKPNAAWERVVAQAATTNPEVLAAVVRACREAGAREVLVVECPVHDSARSLQKSGIRAAAERAGARVILPGDSSYRSVRVSPRLGQWEVLAPFTRADKLINVPIVKHHGSAEVTAGMKNWIGITDRGRSTFHGALNESIVELAALMRPTLTVVDATRVLLRNGPQGGNLDDVREVNAVLVSCDPVAADTWASELLGKRRTQVGYLALAEKKGLGTMDYRALSPIELRV